MTAGRAARLRRLTLALVLAGWTLGGVAGAGAYVHDYSTYRGYPPPRHPPGVAPGRLQTVRFHSAALGRERSYLVSLPPGYERGAAHGRRFPVLYLLHGTSGSPRLLNRVGGVQVALDVLAGKPTGGKFLVVMVDGRDGTPRSDTEWANTRHGRYENLVLDTVRAVDARFSTVQTPEARAIGGLSEGGYGALNIALHHLDTFSTVESWSGYFTQTASGPFRGASGAQLRANSPASYAGGLGPRLRRAPLHVFLYGGNRDRDTTPMPGFAAGLRAAGADVTYRVYPGGHDWRLWRAQVPQMLRYAGAQIGARP